MHAINLSNALIITTLEISSCFNDVYPATSLLAVAEFPDVKPENSARAFLEYGQMKVDFFNKAFAYSNLFLIRTPTVLG